jgi:mRNA interferase MazF
MRAIHTAQMDKQRPVLILTRTEVRHVMAKVTVAPITTRVRGLSTEVRLGKSNGLAEECVVSCDNITTIFKDALGPRIGSLLPEQEELLAEAIRSAFSLS